MQKRVQSNFISVAIGSRQIECADLSVSLVEVERVAIKVSEHVVLENLLVAVQRELLAAHRADFPVALNMLLKLALVIVGWEDHLAERTSLHVHAGIKAEGSLSIIHKWAVCFSCCGLFIGITIVVVLLLLRLLMAFRTAGVACRLYAHHITVPGRRAHWGQPQQLLI